MAIYGNSQTFTLGTQSFTLDACEFNADNSFLGYKRTRSASPIIESDYTMLGTPALKASKFESKFTFEWELILTASRAFELYALFHQQQYNIRTFATNKAIRLVDNRLAYVDSSTNRSRAKTGAFITTPAPPSGFVYFWPQFDILLLEPDNLADLFIPSLELVNVSLKAVELAIVPTSADS